MKFYWRHTAAWIGFTVLTVNFAFADDAAFPQRFADLGACETMSGTSIADCRIGYRTAGTLNEDRSNAVLVPTWFTGISEGLLFLANPEAIDPSTYFIIFADAIGNGVSISPSNSASQPLEKFPQLRMFDWGVAQRRRPLEQFVMEKFNEALGI